MYNFNIMCLHVHFSQELKIRETLVDGTYLFFIDNIPIVTTKTELSISLFLYVHEYTGSEVI